MVMHDVRTQNTSCSPSIFVAAIPAYKLPSYVLRLLMESQTDARSSVLHWGPRTGLQLNSILD